MYAPVQRVLRLAFPALLLLGAADLALAQVEDAFQLVGDRLGQLIGWGRNILLTATVGGLMWSIASWIGTGRLQLKPIMITLVAAIMLAVTQGLLTWVIGVDVSGDVGGAGDSVEDLLDGSGGGGWNF